MNFAKVGDFASVRAFIGNASHELRTPIALLQTEIEVALIRPRDGAQYRETLTQLHRETIRMCALVENLLSIARADAGAETISLQAVMVRELFLRLEREWRTPMRDALLDFRIESGAREFAVLADSAGINRLLTILLENVRNYTPPGGSIPLSATCVGATVTLAVRDKSIGMAPEHPPRIFDRFYRGSQAGDSSARQQAPP